MSKNRTSNSGFTLVEMLVAVAIFAVIVIAALMLYDRSVLVFKRGMEAADVQQITRVAFERVAGDLRMAGFDHDRDGIPAGSSGGVSWEQQPDEQIEHAGTNSITMRANFDYETGTPENGRETDLEAGSGGRFPVITTHNDEIVTYAVESADDSKNTGTIRFWVDAPDRKSFPGAGGRAENLVTVSGVDLTNNNPPYTLNRYTLAPRTDVINVVKTPVASNIRSVNFQYYEDATGVLPLRNLAGAVVTSAVDTAAAGRFDPASGAIVPLRSVRAAIQSVRLTLVAMNDQPDRAYRHPGETSTAPVYGYEPSTPANFRQYRLETLIVPRNYGKQGLKESETVAPGPPTITDVCIGYCGLAYLEWSPPAITATNGTPEDYQILYGTTATSVTTLGANPGLTTSGFVSLADPSLSYYFAVKAINSYGSSTSAVVGPYSAKNATTPSAPDSTAFDATTNTDGARITGGGGTHPAAQANQIVLTWQLPATNASGAITCPLGGGSAPANDRREVKGWQIDRALDAAFTLGVQTNYVNDTTALPMDPATNRASFTDTLVANCVDYYYRIRVVERCTLGAENTGGAAYISASSVPIKGRAESTVKPKAPSSILADSAFSSCSSVSPFTCNVRVTWPKVTEDINSAPASIEEYELTWTRRNAGGAALATGTILVNASSAVSFGTTIAYNHTINRAASTDYIEYQTRAKGLCPGTPLSDPSPILKYPCTFGAMTIDVTGTNKIEGDGSASSPWILDLPANIAVTTSSPVNRIRGTLNPGGIVIGDVTGPTSSASFAWPGGLADGVRYTVNITVENATGCNQDIIKYAQQLSSTNCCLSPVSFQPTLLFVDGPSRFVVVQLKNICNQPLTIQANGVEITWEDSFLTGGGSKRLSDVLYPSSAGAAPSIVHSRNANEGLVTSAPPGGALSVIPVDVAGSADDYKIRITFTKTFTTSPLMNLCVRYRRPEDGITTRACRMLPAPSSVVDSCAP